MTVRDEAVPEWVKRIAWRFAHSDRPWGVIDLQAVILEEHRASLRGKVVVTRE